MLLAGAGSLALTPVVMAALGHWHVVDRPGHRSLHSKPTVRGGGLAPAAVVIAVLALNGGFAGEVQAGLLVAAVGFAGVGLIEDLKGVPPLPRLAAQLVVASAAYPMLVTGSELVGLAYIAVSCAAVLWLAGYTNALNFMDGVNGMATVQVVVAGLAWSVIGFGLDVPVLIWGGLLLACAATGFLPYNFPRAKVFLGDVGSYFFGGCLAALTLVGIGAEVPVHVMLAPLVISLADTGFTLVRRVVHRDIWHQAHREHVYQRLVLLGWSHGQATMYVAAMSLACAALALLSFIAGAWQGVGIAGLLAIAVTYTITPRLVGGRQRRAAHHRGDLRAASALRRTARG